MSLSESTASTTGASPVHGSLRGESRSADESRPGKETNVAAQTLSLAPADCPVCGDAEAEPIAVSEDFGCRATEEALLAMRCSDCGCVYLSPAPEVLYGFTAPPGPAGAARRLARLSRGLDRTRVLGLHDRSDIFTDLGRLPGQHFELVILDGTLEYVHAPLALLVGVRRLLHPRGRVALVLNNLESPSFTVFGGRHWAGYDFPRQRALYSVEALHRLAGRAGLEIRSISSVPDPACWVESLRRVLTDWRAPGWLVRCFTTKALVSYSVFAALEGIFHARRRGACLVVGLSLPTGPATFPPPAADRTGLAR